MSTLLIPAHVAYVAFDRAGFVAFGEESCVAQDLFFRFVPLLLRWVETARGVKERLLFVAPAEPLVSQDRRPPFRVGSVCPAVCESFDCLIAEESQLLYSLLTGTLMHSS